MDATLSQQYLTIAAFDAVTDDLIATQGVFSPEDDQFIQEIINRATDLSTICRQKVRFETIELALSEAA